MKAEEIRQFWSVCGWKLVKVGPDLWEHPARYRDGNMPDHENLNQVFEALEWFVKNLTEEEGCCYSVAYNGNGTFTAYVGGSWSCQPTIAEAIMHAVVHPVTK